MLEIRDYLEELKTGGGYNSETLPHLLKIAGVKAASARKADMVDALDRYLGNPANIEQIWSGLTPLERGLVEEHILSEGHLDSSDIEEIFARHGAKPEPVTGWFNRRKFSDYFAPDSKARLLFMGGRMPSVFRDTLAKKIKPPEPTYQTVADPEQNEYDDRVDGLAIIGDDFAREITRLLKVVNSGKLRVTPSSGLPNKAAIVKIDAALEHKEFVTDMRQDITSFRSIEHTVRHYGLATLLLEAGIIDEADGLLRPGSAAKQFLLLDTAGQCRLLLQAWLKSHHINELQRAREIKTKQEHERSMEPCRKLILDYLANSPVNTWIDLHLLLKYMKRCHRNFLRQVMGNIEVYNEYDRCYCYSDVDWLALEGRFVEVVLLEYLTAMGIVDVAYEESFGGYYDDKPYLSAEYFRLTPLGAYVLGASKDYADPEQAATVKQSGLVVQPDYEIVLQAGRMQDVHALFFDRWAEQVSAGGVSVYRLTFKGIINALDQGTSIREIIAYLQRHATAPLPDNVLSTLQEWEAESKRISIRTVTILETDDPYLLQELRSYKAIDQTVLKELPHAVVIDSKTALKLKREIEKRNHFCNLHPTA